MKKNTKSALLLSVVSIIICCTMLLGTTMAWFTDSVTSNVNKIVAGNLDVELTHTVEGAEETVTESTVLFDDVDLWEPGVVVYENLTVSNAGNLALKYQISLTGLKATTVPGTDKTLKDVIKVGIVEGGFNGTTREDAITAVGEGNWKDLDVFVLNGELEENGNSDTVGVVLYWEPSDNDNDYNMNNGETTVLDITFGLNLFATQYTYEKDSFDDQYDKDATLPTVANVASQEELADAIANGADTIYLADGTYTLPSAIGGKIVALNGSEDAVIDITTSIGVSGANITFNGVTVLSNGGGFANGIQHAGTITYNNATIVGSRSLYGAKEVFNNCTIDLTGVNDYLWTYGAKEVEFNNCLFNTDGKAVLVYNEGSVGSSVVNFTDCTFAASQSAYTGAGDLCAAVEIDGSLIPGTYTVNFNGTNTVSGKFAGLFRVKAQKDPANVTVNQNGTVVTADVAVASDSDELDTAITNGADTVVLGDGNYIIPDSAQGKTLTIIGNGNTVVATQDDGSYEGCDYSLQGSTVTFENITITTDSSTYTGYARLNATYNNCTINGTYTLYGDSEFNNCTFNVSGDAYNIWTWGAPNATFNNCTFNSSGKSLLLYGGTNTKLVVNNCVFNDDNAYADVNNKAAIEVGTDWSTDTKEIIVTDTTVNGFDVTDKGISTGSTLWGNKNSMSTDRLNVVINGVDVY